MTAPIHTLLISLEDAQARRAAAIGQLTAAGFDPVFIPACDGRHRPVDDWDCYDAARARAFLGRPLRGGEIGCYLSHVAALKRFLATDAGVALVFEDDVTITPEAANAIRSALDWLMARPATQWDVINLVTSARKFTRPVDDAHVPGLCRAYYFPLTTAGLAWSRPGAEAFLAQHDRVFAPIDNYLRWWCARRGGGLAYRRAPLAVSGAPSLIHPSGGARDMAQSRSARFTAADAARRMLNYARAIRHLAMAGLYPGYHEGAK